MVFWRSGWKPFVTPTLKPKDDKAYFKAFMDQARGLEAVRVRSRTDQNNMAF